MWPGVWENLKYFSNIGTQSHDFQVMQYLSTNHLLGARKSLFLHLHPTFINRCHSYIWRCRNKEDEREMESLMRPWDFVRLYESDTSWDPWDLMKLRKNLFNCQPILLVFTKTIKSMLPCIFCHQTPCLHFALASYHPGPIPWSTFLRCQHVRFLLQAQCTTSYSCQTWLCHPASHCVHLNQIGIQWALGHETAWLEIGQTGSEWLKGQLKTDK